MSTAGLRAEIQGAFQEIVLPQIQKDLSDMRRDLQLLSSGRLSGDGRRGARHASGREAPTEHFPPRPRPGRDTVVGSDSGDLLAESWRTSPSPQWATSQRPEAAHDPPEAAKEEQRAVRYTNKARDSNLTVFVAKNAAHKKLEEQQPPFPPHYITEDSEDGGRECAEVSQVHPPAPVVGRPKTPADPEPSLVMESPNGSSAVVVPLHGQELVAQGVGAEGQDRVSRGSGWDSPDGGRRVKTRFNDEDALRLSAGGSSIASRDSNNPSGAGLFKAVSFGPDVVIQKNPKLKRTSTQGDLSRAGLARQSLYNGRVAMAVAKAGEKKTPFREWLLSFRHTEAWQGLSARAVLTSFRFDNVISLLILANSVTIGLEADYAARNVTDESPFGYRVIEIFFCVCFTTELLLRVYVYRAQFFLKKETGVLWNYFDLLVVSAQLVQEVFELMQSGANDGNDAGNLRILRILRVLRIVRIFRLVRVLHLISELRTIVSSIIGSFRSLFWTVLLLLLMMYIVGVWFLQTVTDWLITNYSTGDEVTLSDGGERLKHHFASLPRTIISLWQALSGGVDWSDMGDPMMEEIDPFFGLAFAAFIAFSLLALMNVVTGVFVQTALHSAEREEENFLTDQIIGLFHKCKGEDNWGTISEKDLEERLEDPDMAKEWKNINVSASEAKYVFELLDVEETGQVQFEEFLSACLRLRGTAKSLDMLIQMQESRQTRKVMENALNGLAENVTKITDTIQEKVNRVLEDGEAVHRVLQTVALKPPKQPDGKFDMVTATPSTSDEEV